MKAAKTPTPDRIMQFAWGYAPTLILHTALEFKVFDLLHAKPATVAELARTTGASPRGLTAVLDALVGLSFLAKEGGRYTVTPESAAFLVSTKPGYLGAFFGHMADQILPKWLTLPRVVRTGKSAVSVNARQGAKFFAQFVESLFPLSHANARELGEHLGLGHLAGPLSVLDIAAGSGVWGLTLAGFSPFVQVTAVDWPEVLKVTRRIAKQRGVEDRLTTVAGDILEVDFGAGHHVATLGHILHSEGEERSRRLLKRTFDALLPGGTIAIMEFVPNEERTGPPDALIFAVNMLVNTDQGGTYTFSEISQWLAEAGFVRPRLLKVPAISPLILATKPAE